MVQPGPDPDSYPPIDPRWFVMTQPSARPLTGWVPRDPYQRAAGRGSTRTC